MVLPRLVFETWSWVSHIHKSGWIFIIYCARTYKRDQPVIGRVLSLVEKTSHRNTKFWPPLNLVPKKLCWSKLSELIWHLMSKLYVLVVRWLFVSRNGIKVQFLGVVGFKSSTLTVYCLSSWFVQQQRKTCSYLCVLCWHTHLSWFQGPKDIPPSFWPWVTNHDVKPKVLKKWFLKLLIFYTNFSRCWKV